MSRNQLQGAQHRERVGGRAETDVPEDKLPSARRRHTMHEVQLLDVEGLCLGNGSDHGVERFALGEGAHAPGTIDELDELVVGNRNGHQTR